MAFDFGWNRGVETSIDLLSDTFQLRRSVIQEGEPSRLAEQLSNCPLPWILLRVPVSGVRTLQQVLKIQTDGIPGRETVSRLASRPELRISAMVAALAGAQMQSYKKLANFETYGRGWLARLMRRQTLALTAANVGWPEHPSLT